MTVTVRFVTNQMTEGTGKIAFATVGTTKFDIFIRTLTQIDVLQSLKEKGYTTLIVQKGNGTEIPNMENAMKLNMNLSYYEYKNSIKEDIQKADLVISHAGAGTCLEVLSEGKPLLVVINEDLMDNHQRELADQLSSDMYLLSCTCSTLNDTIKQMDLSKLEKMQMTQSNLFSRYLNNFMGFDEDDSR